MLERLQNRTTAWILTLIAVAAAILLGGRASLLTLRGQAEQVFFQGEGNAYACISYDLSQIVDDSYNLTTVSSSYLEAADPVVKRVLDSRQALETAATPGAKHDAAENLRDAVEGLDSLLTTLPLSEADRAYQSKLAVNIQSRYKTIENNRYNSLAEGYNRELTGFPAGAIAAVTGVEPLELYE